MTKEEWIQEVRSVGRICRGDYPAAERAMIQVKKLKLLAQGRREEAARFDAASRIPCGYDFNATIVAGPFDGEIHHYTCPRCGLTGTYRAPTGDTP